MTKPDPHEWETPPEVFKEWNDLYNFTLDVAASNTNAKCGNYFTKENNGLSQSWREERCWMNPPYDRTLGEWVKKAYTESKDSNAVVVCLLPARTDTAWWHDYCLQGEIKFIRRRLKFSDWAFEAPFASAVVIFDFQSKNKAG